jgi:DGQHR domain-containing protein
MSLIIDAIPFAQNKTRMFIGTVPIDNLETFSIDTWDPKNVVGLRGYQRAPYQDHVNKIAKFFERKDAIMPVAGLLNVRDTGRLKYKNGKLTIPDGVFVWVVDMQHRLKGLIRAKDEGLIRGNDFRFPVVITEGLTQMQEAAQFYVINTKAKKMDVALTRRLLIENDAVNEIADAKRWEIDAVIATIDLNTKIRDNPWYGAIRPPNHERLLSHVATEKSFVPSMRQIFLVGRYKQPHKIAKRMAAYWRAIQQNIPDAFQEPKKYIIQKTPGMFVFNFFIAPLFLTRVKDKDFEKRLGGLRNLGADFWRGSNKRGARRFGTGMGAYSELAVYVRSKIRI